MILQYYSVTDMLRGNYTESVEKSHRIILYSMSWGQSQRWGIIVIPYLSCITLVIADETEQKCAGRTICTDFSRYEEISNEKNE